MVKFVQPKPGTSITWSSNRLKFEISALQERLEVMESVDDRIDHESLHQIKAAISYREAILKAIDFH